MPTSALRIATSRTSAVPMPRPCSASSTSAANSAWFAPVGVALEAGDAEHALGAGLRAPAGGDDGELQLRVELDEARDVGRVERERTHEARTP
jgi:hypothetical protein